MKCNEPGNYKGTCCCNCKHRLKVMKHPWNKGEAKGRITELMGYACPMGDEEGSIKLMFLQREHSACELHEYKENNLNEETN